MEEEYKSQSEGIKSRKSIRVSHSSIDFTYL